MLAAAGGAEIGNGFAHGLKNGESGIEIRPLTAYQNGQRTRLGTGIAAGNRRVQHPQAALGTLLGNALCQCGAGGGHINEQCVLGGAVQNGAGSEINLLHILGEAHHGDDHITGLYAVGDAVMEHRALGHHIRDLFRVAGINMELISGLHQIADHGLSHDTDADPTDLLHGTFLLFRCLLLAWHSLLPLSSNVMTAEMWQNK